MTACIQQIYNKIAVIKKLILLWRSHANPTDTHTHVLTSLHVQILKELTLWGLSCTCVMLEGSTTGLGLRSVSIMLCHWGGRPTKQPCTGSKDVCTLCSKFLGEEISSLLFFFFFLWNILTACRKQECVPSWHDSRAMRSSSPHALKKTQELSKLNRRRGGAVNLTPEDTPLFLKQVKNTLKPETESVLLHWY